MTRRVYVACASAEIDRARAVFEIVRSLGHVVAYDWITEIEQAGGSLDVSRSTGAQIASEEIEAIQGADALVLLTSEHISAGAHVELGVALASSVPVYVSGPRTCLFVDLCAPYESDRRAVLAAVHG